MWIPTSEIPVTGSDALRKRYTSADALSIVVSVAAVTAVSVSILLGWQVEILAGIGAAFVAGCAVLILWRQPVLGLIVLLIGVPLHSLALLVLTGVLSAPALPTQAFTMWKELLLIVLLGVILARWLRRGSARLRMGVVDILGIAYLLLVVFYLLVPSAAVGWGGRLRAARTDAVFLLAFWVGRGLYPGRKWLKRLVYLTIGLAALGGLGAVIERFFLPHDILLRLGLEQYFAFLGVPGVSSLPIQFFSAGGLGVQRAGSLYINPIELSFGMLAGLSLGVSLVMSGLWRARPVVVLAIGLMLAGLILSIVRSALLGLAVSMILIMLGSRLTRRVVIILTLTAVILIALGAHLGLARLAVQTVTLTDPSSRWRLEAWRQSLEAIVQRPWGWGLGTVGALAERFADPSVRITSENWYLQIGIELGVVGLILYLGTITLVAYRLLVYYRLDRDVFRRALTFGMLAGLVGLSFVGQFLHVWGYLSLSIPFWLLMGLCWASHTERYAHRH